MVASRPNKIPLKRRVPELPPKIARGFVAATKAYFSEKDGIKRDEIAVLQLRTLQDHWPGKLRLDDIRAMFYRMREDGLR
jgi:hypothetical protein